MKKPSILLQIFLFCTLILSLSGVLLAEKIDVQAELDAIYNTRSASIERENKPLADLDQRCRMSLQKQKEIAKEAGDLDGVLAADKELSNLDGGAMPKEVSAHPEIAKIQKEYRTQQAELKKRIKLRMSALDSECCSQLEKLTKKLTQAGLIEEAVEVRDIRQKFMTDANSQSPSPQIPKRSLQQTTDQPEKPQKMVVIDRYHGRSLVLDSIEATFRKQGWQVRYIDAPIQEATLKGANLYFIDTGKPGQSIYSKNELDLLENFYTRGQGCLLLAGITWVWIAYDKQNVENLPANQIGNRLGFVLPHETSEAIEDHSKLKIKDFLAKTDLTSVKYKGIVANHIKPKESVRGRFKPLIETGNGKNAMALLESNSSACVIAGHEGFFSYYPNTDFPPIFQAVISYFEVKMRLDK